MVGKPQQAHAGKGRREAPPARGPEGDRSRRFGPFCGRCGPDEPALPDRRRQRRTVLRPRLDNRLAKRNEQGQRSDKRRGGKELCRPCRSRWSLYNTQKKPKLQNKKKK